MKEADPKFFFVRERESIFHRKAVYFY